MNRLMRCADVNVLVYAHREDATDHLRYRHWLESARSAPTPLGLSSQVLAGFVRVVTHPRVFAVPTPTSTAFAFVDSLVSSPAVELIAPGERHWGIFERLCATIDARGNDVPDAYLAAIAVEHGAEWYTADRGFARFSELVVRDPREEV